LVEVLLGLETLFLFVLLLLLLLCPFAPLDLLVEELCPFIEPDFMGVPLMPPDLVLAVEPRRLRCTRTFALSFLRLAFFALPCVLDDFFSLAGGL
jgi:hypothetical protein